MSAQRTPGLRSTISSSMARRYWSVGVGVGIGVGVAATGRAATPPAPVAVLAFPGAAAFFCTQQMAQRRRLRHRSCRTQLLDAMPHAFSKCSVSGSAQHSGWSGWNHVYSERQLTLTRKRLCCCRAPACHSRSCLIFCLRSLAASGGSGSCSASTITCSQFALSVKARRTVNHVWRVHFE